MIRLSFILYSTFFITSCSVINISTDDEVGFLNVIQPPNTGAYVDLDFVGIGLVDNDFILGYKQSKNIVLPDNACTIFIDEKSHIDNTTLAYLKSANCIFIYMEKKK